MSGSTYSIGVWFNGMLINAESNNPHYAGGGFKRFDIDANARVDEFVKLIRDKCCIEDSVPISIKYRLYINSDISTLLDITCCQELKDIMSPGIMLHPFYVEEGITRIKEPSPPATVQRQLNKFRDEAFSAHEVQQKQRREQQLAGRKRSTTSNCKKVEERKRQRLQEEVEGQQEQPSPPEVKPPQPSPPKVKPPQPSPPRVKPSIDGCPDDPSLLYTYKYHISSKIWNGSMEDRVLTARCQVSTVDLWNLKEECTYVQQKVEESGFSTIMFYAHRKTDDVIVNAFVERFYPETNTFHLPFGEMMITLDEVHHFLSLPIDGVPVEEKNGGAKKLKWDDIYTLLKDTLGLDKDEAMTQLKDGTVKSLKLEYLRQKFSGSKASDPKQKMDMCVRAYLLYVIGCCICPDRSGNKVPVYYLHCLRDVNKVKNYSWGTACLAQLLYELATASRVGSKQIAGCLTLLQVWIYEHFPTLGRRKKCDGFEHGMPKLRRWAPEATKKNLQASSLKNIREEIDDLRDIDVIWDPFKNSRDKYPLGQWAFYSGMIVCFEMAALYLPDRVLRQFGVVQHIPPRPCKHDGRRSKTTNKHFTLYYAQLAVWNWNNWRNHLLNNILSKKAQNPEECSLAYIGWYLKMSHPIVSNPSTRQTEVVRPAIPTPEDEATSLLSRIRQRLTKMKTILETCEGGVDRALSPTNRNKLLRIVEHIEDDEEDGGDEDEAEAEDEVEGENGDGAEYDEEDGGVEDETVVAEAETGNEDEEEAGAFSTEEDGDDH